MSWNVSGSSLTPGSILTIPEPVFHNAEAESREQFEKARRAASDIAYAGVVGDRESKLFNVTLSGHANDGHEPSGEWGRDWVSLQVTQI